MCDEDETKCLEEILQWIMSGKLYIRGRTGIYFKSREDYELTRFENCDFDLRLMIVTYAIEINPEKPIIAIDLSLNASNFVFSILTFGSFPANELLGALDHSEIDDDLKLPIRFTRNVSYLEEGDSTDFESQVCIWNSLFHILCFQRILYSLLSLLENQNPNPGDKYDLAIRSLNMRWGGDQWKKPLEIVTRRFKCFVNDAVRACQSEKRFTTG
jgi:hypothetical protein